MRSKIFFLVTAAMLSALCSEVRIAADFRGLTPPGRAIRDIRFPCDLSNAKGLAFDLKVDCLDEFSMFTFHFDCNGKWVGAPLKPQVEGRWARVTVERPKTSDGKHDWSKVGQFRISGWRAGTNRTYLAVRNIVVVPAVAERKLSKKEREIRQTAIAATNRMSLAKLAAIPAPDGERRMIWAHNPTGIRGKDWEYSVSVVKKCGFTDLIANLLRGPVAAYRSGVLEPAKMFKGRECLEECLAACRRHGVKLHVWNCCWRTGWGMTKEDIAKLASEGRLQKTKGGEVKEWLCPSHPANRKMLVDSMMELAGKGVAGIHFDYIRYPDGSYCYCDGCRDRFEKKVGVVVSDWPDGLRRDPVLDRKWREFRRDTITSPVAEVSKRVRREFPGVEVSAAVFTSPQADWDWMGQDWPSWCEKGYMDFVCPMTYSENLEEFVRQQRKHARQVTSKVPRYPGIGLGVWPKDGLDVARLAERIAFLRKSGYRGFSVYELSRRFDRLSAQLAEGMK